VSRLPGLGRLRPVQARLLAAPGLEEAQAGLRKASSSPESLELQPQPAAQAAEATRSARATRSQGCCAGRGARERQGCQWWQRWGSGQAGSTPSQKSLRPELLLRELASLAGLLRCTQTPLQLWLGWTQLERCRLRRSPLSGAVSVVPPCSLLSGITRPVTIPQQSHSCAAGAASLVRRSRLPPPATQSSSATSLPHCTRIQRFRLRPRPFWLLLRTRALARVSTG